MRGRISVSTGSTPVGVQRVDLVVELHRADLGRERAARAAGHDDCGKQHAQFPKYTNRDQVHHVDVGAVVAQLGGREVGNDHADQEGDQRDDGNGGDPRVVDMPGDGDGSQAPPVRQAPPNVVAVRPMNETPRRSSCSCSSASADQFHRVGPGVFVQRRRSCRLVGVQCAADHFDSLGQLALVRHDHVGCLEARRNWSSCHAPARSSEVAVLARGALPARRPGPAHARPRGWPRCSRPSTRPAAPVPASLLLDGFRGKPCTHLRCRRDIFADGSPCTGFRRRRRVPPTCRGSGVRPRSRCGWNLSPRNTQNCCCCR